MRKRLFVALAFAAIVAFSSSTIMEPHLFYQGKEIGVVMQNGVQMGKASCEAEEENEPTHAPHKWWGVRSGRASSATSRW